MRGFVQDLRYAVRMLGKSPGATIVITVTLALGIGANTAMFSVVNTVLLRPLPYDEPDRLVVVWHQFLEHGFKKMWLSEPEFLDYRERNTVFQDLAVWEVGGANLTGNGHPERVTGARVSPNLFAVLGVDAMLGRTFLAHESEPGRGGVAVLSHGLWQRRFGGDRNVLDRTMELDGVSYTIVGVMPPGFGFPSEDVDGWIPRTIDKSNLRIRGNHFLTSVARLKPGVTVEQAQSEIRAIWGKLREENPRVYPDGWGVYLKRLPDEVVGDVRPALVVLLCAVGLVLLIACVNVANVLLARSVARGREVAIRAALGAGRRHIIRQLLTESTVLALLGGAAGVLVALWGIQAVLAVGPANVPRLTEVAIDGRVLGFAVVVSLLTGVLFGLAPALHALGKATSRTLKNGCRTSPDRGRHRLRQLLVVSEVALSLMLLIGAGLMIRSLQRELRVDPGFRTEGVLTMQLALPEPRYTEDHQAAAFYREVEEHIRALPNVRHVGSISHLPLGGGHLSGGTFIEDAPRNFSYLPHAMIETDWRTVTPGFFAAMGVELLRGRGSPRPTTPMLSASWSSMRASPTASGRTLIRSASESPSTATWRRSSGAPLSA